jgi:hypothetical protein
VSFVIPEPGSDAMVDLLCRIDQARYEEAKAFVVIAIDEVTGQVAHTTGPFAEPEHALIEAGRQDADWKAHAEPEEGDYSYVVVPLWEPDA